MATAPDFTPLKALRAVVEACDEALGACVTTLVEIMGVGLWCFRGAIAIVGE